MLWHRLEQCGLLLPSSRESLGGNRSQQEHGAGVGAALTLAPGLHLLLWIPSVPALEGQFQQCLLFPSPSGAPHGMEPQLLSPSVTLRDCHSSTEGKLLFIADAGMLEG